MTGEETLREQMRLLQHGFIAKLPARIDAMEQAMHQWIAGGDEASLRALHRLLHSLAGTAGTFDLPDTGDEARRLEDIVASWLADDQIAESDVKAFAVALQDLRRLSEAY
ncbi:MAG TPA: Hpt domain-containing protein [Noviherbaspirillum sp.]|uniref:Hpt domain-containing protein n=1 Tax=Noviherbaspirillum sp. TaxID=1926288 RepID=UPI002DDC922B|nr:Hpt domain-containing protein [Noviherbaspirillum sp.]HEV2610353.1 Hpt domain-containing protein [Noviherbaspirillum sp.]